MSARHHARHARAYAPLKMRSGFGACGAVLIFYYDLGVTGRYFDGEYFPAVIVGRICLFAMTTLFSFITLPVEINASQRALVWLSKAGITNSYNHHAAEDALRSAAYTYVVAALHFIGYTDLLYNDLYGTSVTKTL